MTNNNTKRALLTSVMALLLCFTMLLGTTFAWFTDSAVSANNKISTGNLDVELYKWTDATTATAISESKAPVFDSSIIWEPNYTSVVYLSIKNNGTLALKYTVAIDVTEVTGSNLADVMEYTLADGAKYGEVTSWAGNGTKFENAPGMNETTYKNVELQPGEEKFFAISIHMLGAEAGNEYMGSTIAFDIRVLAAQLMSENDSFGNNYDANATYPVKGITTVPTSTASAYDIEVRDNHNNGNYKIGSVTIPATATKAGAQDLTVVMEKVAENANITVAANEEIVTYDVSVVGLKENNNELIDVELRIPEGLDPATVKVYHHEVLIDSSYNPNTGYVTFQTATFSPFSVVYDAKSEYEAPEVPEVPAGSLPAGIPVATVTYASEHVGEGKITWGNFGDWSPAEGLDSDLEAAFVFACPESEELTAFEYWYCDFYVSLDRELGENQIFLGGNYGSFGWVGFHNGDVTLAANEEIGLLEGVTTNPWTYSDVKNFVGTFTCGVGDVDNALEGATFTVKLRLTNPENPDQYYDVNVVTYTFGGDYRIQ